MVWQFGYVRETTGRRSINDGRRRGARRLYVEDCRSWPPRRTRWGLIWTLKSPFHFFGSDVEGRSWRRRADDPRRFPWSSSWPVLMFAVLDSVLKTVIFLFKQFGSFFSCNSSLEEDLIVSLDGPNILNCYGG